LGFVPQRQPTTVGFGINAFSVRSGVLKGVEGVGDEAIRCHFCGRLCSDSLRLDYLHRTTPSQTSDRKITHWLSTLRDLGSR